MQKQIIKEEKVLWFPNDITPAPSESMCSILVKLSYEHRNMIIPAFYARGHFFTMPPQQDEPHRIENNEIIAWCYTPKFSSNYH